MGFFDAEEGPVAVADGELGVGEVGKNCGAVEVEEEGKEKGFEVTLGVGDGYSDGGGGEGELGGGGGEEGKEGGEEAVGGVLVVRHGGAVMGLGLVVPRLVLSGLEVRRCCSSPRLLSLHRSVCDIAGNLWMPSLENTGRQCEREDYVIEDSC